MSTEMSISSPNILVVEDESLVALDICNELKTLGYPNVRTAGSAADALELAKAHPPDLALLDIHIKGRLDGVSLAEKLKEQNDIPIVYLTAFADRPTVDRAAKTLPHGYLLKPVQPKELRSTVELALYKQRIEAERAQAEARARELERQLLQAQKMDAIGALTAGLAHELNNALFVVMGNLNLAIMHPSLPRSVSERLDHAIEGCNRSANLLKQMLGFAKKGVLRPEILEINEFVQEAIDFLSQVLEKDTELSLAASAEPLHIEFDREQLYQVLTNLVINAQQAMPNGGRIVVKIGRTSVDDTNGLNSEAKPGSYATIHVVDEGQGIHEEDIDHIFEPFYSKKETGEGTGLGLAVVYGIVQRHGGWVNVKSELGSGTTFTLFVPLQGEQPTSDLAAERLEESAPQESSVKKAKTILVIDDEEMIVDVTSKTLERRGFKAIGYSSAREALAWYEENSSSVDMVILDMKMPDMDGKASYQRIRQVKPNEKVLVFSGYAKGSDIDTVLHQGVMGVFQKPVDFEALIEKMQEIFKSEAQSAALQ